jgi:hypothetical protein
MPDKTPSSKWPKFTPPPEAAVKIFHAAVKGLPEGEQ